MGIIWRRVYSTIVVVRTDRAVVMRVFSRFCGRRTIWTGFGCCGRSLVRISMLRECTVVRVVGRPWDVGVGLWMVDAQMAVDISITVSVHVFRSRSRRRLVVMTIKQDLPLANVREKKHLFLRLGHGLDSIATLDRICLEIHWSGPAMEFEEEATGIAESSAEFVAAPERCGRRAAVLADRGIPADAEMRDTVCGWRLAFNIVGCIVFPFAGCHRFTGGSRIGHGCGSVENM
jgi:hypothetical protein